MSPDTTRPAPIPSREDDSGREARIEQLLVSGLDQYFAGQYEQAINIWTRVIFLERGHSRARAYIERARSALAERQRESEEMLHGGVAAYNAGQLDVARDLLTRAVDHGGPHDTALVFLERLSRANPAVTPGEQPAGQTALASARIQPSPRASGDWFWTIVVSLGVMVLVLVASLSAVSWFTDVSQPAGSVPPDAVEPLPVVRSADIDLARARELATQGRLHDGLAVLDRIPPTDVLAAEADRLRGDIQRQLLAAASPGAAGVRR